MSIEVSGGAGGMGATFQDLRSFATVLDRAGDDVRTRADDVAKIALDESVVAAALLCPVEAATVVGAVAGCTAALVTVSAAFEGSAVVLRASVETYVFLDEATQRVMDALAAAGGFALGAVLPFAVVGGIGIALVNPLATGAVVLAVARNPDAVLDPIFANPWITEALAKELPWIVQGSSFTLLGPVLPVLLSGGRWPSPSYEDALAGLVSAGSHVGALEDSGSFHVVPADTLGSTPAESVSDLFGEVTELYRKENTGQIEITARKNPDGHTSWIVQIPGTEAWTPFRGDNPFDLSTNVTLMNEQSTVLQAQIAQAMQDAGIQEGDPVMLSGHSQGGIAAAAMASDPQFTAKYDVRSVVTAGAPIATFDIPDGISVLALEHDQDMVPMLDGYENPDRPNWVTVERDLADVPDVDPQPVAAHASDLYARTGSQVDASTDPTIVAWREENARFFDSRYGAGVQRFLIEPAAP